MASLTYLTPKGHRSSKIPSPCRHTHSLDKLISHTFKTHHNTLLLSFHPHSFSKWQNMSFKPHFNGLKLHSKIPLKQCNTWKELWGTMNVLRVFNALLFLKVLTDLSVTQLLKINQSSEDYWNYTELMILFRFLF